MSNFVEFSKAIKAQVDKMMQAPVLFVTGAAKEDVYTMYLESFPDGTNPMYRERREYDCNCCKNFIRDLGNVVAINDDLSLTSIWDVEVPYPFNAVAKNLSRFVKGCDVKDVFYHWQKNVGAEKTNEIRDNKVVATWNHFYAKLDSKFVKPEAAAALMAQVRDNKNVFERACKELTDDSIDTVLDLISQNSLYRGTEFKGLIEIFKRRRNDFLNFTSSQLASNYCWKMATEESPAVCKIRNSAIGTILVNLSEGMELETAVSAYERVMAPANYRRPTALVTKTMINQAEKDIVELGLEPALARRYAEMEDITINNVLFANRDAKKVMTSVFDDLKANVTISPKTFDKVEEITIENFIKNVLPRVSKVGVLFEKKHMSNMVSLIAPVDKTAGGLFKWNNNFSWAYKGDIADAMKERVKAAGGNVDGVLRYSIQWNEDGNSICDLDAHAFEPTTRGRHIYYSSGYRKDRGNIKTSMSGQLDVDMICPRGVGVENITWTDLDKMAEGDYGFTIRNFDNGRNTGFSAQVEFDGQIHEFHYRGNLQGRMDVAVVTYSKAKGFSIKACIPSSEILPPSIEEWGIKTNQFIDVSVMMYSPNYWDDQIGIGNKHYFFILKDCKCPDSARGFFNEFLKESLTKHRKTFEVLGSKLKAPSTDNQLSGLGFSSTQKNSLIVKVEGTALTRTLKIIF